MKTNLSFSPPAEVETECLVAIVVDKTEKNSVEKGKPQVSIETSDAAVKDAAADVIASGEVTGKAFETTLLHHPAKLKAKRLLLLGGGKAKTFSAFDLRRLAGAAVRTLKSKGMRSFAFVAPEAGLPAEEAVKAIVEGAFVGNFDPDYYKSDRKDQKIDALTVVARGDQTKLQAAMTKPRIIGESQNFTRDLVNEPGNRMTPTILAERAQKMAEEVGLQCEVYGADKIKELKMGAFWSVAQGSDEPPALIVLRYEPAGAPEKPVLGLVGKGITFDTGGISIKPADGMEKMKYDMAGGATMIGAMRAIALLKPKVQSHGNRLRHRKYAVGQSAEAGRRADRHVRQIHRDHQHRRRRPPGPGRRPLLRPAARLHAPDRRRHAHRRSRRRAGLRQCRHFRQRRPDVRPLQQSLAKAGEKMWRMPLDDEYKEIIRSNIADIVNSGGRWGGAITAAMFLKEFAEDTPWLHLDIAGTAWTEEQKPWIAKGPSGIALRSLVEFAKDFAG